MRVAIMISGIGMAIITALVVSSYIAASFEQFAHALGL